MWLKHVWMTTCQLSCQPWEVWHKGQLPCVVVGNWELGVPDVWLVSNGVWCQAHVYWCLMLGLSDQLPLSQILLWLQPDTGCLGLFSFSLECATARLKMEITAPARLEITAWWYSIDTGDNGAGMFSEWSSGYGCIPRVELKDFVAPE